MRIVGAVAIDAFIAQTAPHLIAVARGASGGGVRPGQGKAGAAPVIVGAHLLPRGDLVAILTLAAQSPKVRIIAAVAGGTGGGGAPKVAVAPVARCAGNGAMAACQRIVGEGMVEPLAIELHQREAAAPVV